MRQRLQWFFLLAVMIISFPVALAAQTLSWQTAQLIENNAGYSGFSPQVTISGLNVVAVWQQSDGSNFRIYSNYSTDGGATWQTTAQLIENNAGHEGDYPQVAMSGLNVVAVWQQNDGSNFRIYSNYGTFQGSDSIPTMNEWGMIVFMILAGLGAAYYLRRQKKA